MSPSGDLPNLDYTINDPAFVECPFCHKTMNLEDELKGMVEYDINCHHCARWIIIKTTTEVLAYRPEALK
jgi:hypothetical protein